MLSNMARSALLAATTLLPVTAYAQDQDRRIAELERNLAEARNVAAALQKTIDGLADEVKALRGTASAPLALAPAAQARPSSADAPADPYREQILRPDLGENEREHQLSARPELFIQSRFQALPI